jgi:hypothetical protein
MRYGDALALGYSLESLQRDGRRMMTRDGSRIAIGEVDDPFAGTCRILILELPTGERTEIPLSGSALGLAGAFAWIE